MHPISVVHVELDCLSGAHPRKSLTLTLSKLINYLELFMYE